MKQHNFSGSVVKAFYIYLFVAGALALNLAPLLLGSLEGILHYSAKQAGNVVGINLFALALVSFIGFISLHRWHLRVTVSLGAVLAVLGHLLSMQAATATEMLFVQALAGLGSGMMLVSALGILGTFKDPDAMVALAFFGQVLFMMIAFQFAEPLLSTWSINGLFALFAIVSAPAAVLPHLLPRRAVQVERSENSNGSTLITTASVLVLVSVLLVYASNTAIFAFAELIGAAKEIARTTIHNALSGSALSAMLCALLVSFVGTRFGRSKPLISGITLMALSFVLIEAFTTAPVYVLAVCLLLGSLAIALPYMIGILIQIDPGGRLASFANCLVFLGAAIGPFIAGKLISGSNGYDFFILVAVCCASILLALILLTAVVRTSK